MKKILKPEYLEIALDFENTYESCSCHVCAPCDYCTHEGNPINLAETPDAWDEELTYNKLMHREEWIFVDLAAEEQCFTTPILAKDIETINLTTKTILIDHAKAQELRELFHTYTVALLPPDATGVEIKVTEQTKRAMTDTNQLM